MRKVLVVDDEVALRRSVLRLVEGLGLSASEAEDGVRAQEAIGLEKFDLVVTDLRMPRASGLQVLTAARRRQIGTQVLVLTGLATVQECVEAMRQGAFNVLYKPVETCELEANIRGALRLNSHEAAATSPPQIPPGNEGSVLMRDLYAMLARVARTNSSLLITGESGTGKEVAALWVHSHSTRSAGPFVAVNCGAISPGLVESELFGHVKGAFTGADAAHRGLFEAASGGTLLLDEIGELPLSAQVKLLRVLQERVVMPVGSTREIPVDVRVIAASHVDLEEAVAAGRFREDLLYRISVVAVHVPALCERAETVPALAEYFLEELNLRLGRKVTLPPNLLDLLVKYSWPGNVRELHNCIERLVVLAPETEARIDDLPRPVRTGPVAAAPASASSLLREEWRLIDEALRQTEGNKTRAAELLGIKRTTLVEKLKRRRSHQ